MEKKNGLDCYEESDLTLISPGQSDNKHGDSEVYYSNKKAEGK